MPETDKALLTISEVMAALPSPLSRPTVLAWISRGVGGQRLKAVRIGRRFFVRRDDLFGFLAAMQNAPEPAEPESAALTKTTEAAQ